MKPQTKTTDSVWSAFRPQDCPAGCTTCSHDKDRFATRFEHTTLHSGQWLSAGSYRAHRILFVLSGKIYVCIDGTENHYLAENQCLFLVKNRTTTLRAQDESEACVLYFNNRIILCHNDLLVNVASHEKRRTFEVPVLPVLLPLRVFFNNLGMALENSKLNIPCYHIVKQHELFMLMWNLYEKEQLGCFFRNILKPKDDFRQFVLSTYLQAATLEEMARIASLSKSTFIRRFNDTFGETYHKWRVKQKVADIQQAVQDGMRTEEELIGMFGFQSYRALYNFCLRNLKMTPKKLLGKYSPMG